MSEHSTDYFFPREKWFLKHPEWFCLINGVREPLQICYSNADAVNEYITSYCDFVKTHHDFEFIDIWPLDGGGYCECENCKDPLTILKANEKIADAISKVRPDLTVEHLAYTPQSLSCPEYDLPDNLSVLVCSIQDAQVYQLELFKSYLELQKLFFECIDQFNFETDSADKVTPYFNMLEKLQNQYGNIFISPDYARWRIVGRDNLLDPKKTDTLF